jgi:hypothetical protein
MSDMVSNGAGRGVQLGGLVDGAAPRRLLTVFSYGGEFSGRWCMVEAGGS